MRRVAAALCVVAMLVVPWVAWGQRAGTVGQDGEWNLRHVGSVVHVTGIQSPHLTSFSVINCGTSAAVAVQPKADTLGRRRDVILQNGGSGTIFVGGSHATITAAQGLGLHSGAVATGRLTLENFLGRVDCITVSDTQTLNVIEIWR